MFHFFFLFFFFKKASSLSLCYIKFLVKGYNPIQYSCLMKSQYFLLLSLVFPFVLFLQPNVNTNVYLL